MATLPSSCAMLRPFYAEIPAERDGVDFAVNFLPSGRQPA
jgi:hypothetical protein